MSEPIRETVVRPRLPVDVGRSLAPLGTGLHVVAWGPGAEWAVAAAPELLGCRDSVDDFAYERHPVVRDLHRARPGLRIVRSRAVFELTVPTIVHQKVIGGQARDSYRELVRRYGEPAPGPAGLLLPPSARTLAGLPYHAFHPFGIEMKRANSIRIAAVNAAKLDAMVALEPAAARDRLTLIPGIGPWTAANVAFAAFGDADAVPLGDFHLPSLVSWALAGEPRGTDERMLELLEPFAGHRGRVVRLLKTSGIRAPRYGPRLRYQYIRGI
jgi:3-methyladenine DNA glycosylase/8-oxoguanine DNA glycosylase